jgi:hypothetical protein
MCSSYRCKDHDWSKGFSQRAVGGNAGILTLTAHGRRNCVHFPVQRETAGPIGRSIGSGAMKLGFGLYRHMLDDAHFAFARQCGATHIVAHMCDYFRGSDHNDRGDQPVGDGTGWGVAEGRIWTV